MRRVSEMLYEELGGIEGVWPNVQRLQDLWFFPVDNTQARRDPVIQELMRTVERVALAEEYITKLVWSLPPFLPLVLFAGSSCPFCLCAIPL